ncbi:serine/threonine kinase-like domain-containing protein STKLD1 isoform X2 [Lingula anatina]|uniref:non-specific serine/threonine protein kinase n=1 Tax=Lingula anatina TaxID=7574 RepID=A0A1S3HS77_LINAN|nr:serine/threonine kinase-like domain-containing protein STKLD1 isoform X2 [Lingula anatina]|eukprot:XP_013388890.1 serine/threonine kinase-like domain-containing protein STKLD1 isoform X2 [Lingula anatina]
MASRQGGWIGFIIIHFLAYRSSQHLGVKKYKKLLLAMALKELQHRSVCGYREFFVQWEKEESAMFVCIVMDHYKLGDLEKVLKQKRDKKENIEELIIKKWLGQIVEALVFVHKKGIIHRDLKPSNIFMKEDLSICLGDFGVATVMGDARTKTRTTVGSMNWMAPEVLEKPYDERSDVWSAGCILLEMATCGRLMKQEIAQKLFEIKNDPQVLEQVLEDIQKQKYSADLVSLIRIMLRRNFKQRPTAVELLDLPYIQDCLVLCDSELAEKKKKKQSSNQEKKPVPKDQGVPPVLSFIRENINNDGSVRDALEYLAALTKQEGITVTDDGKRLIAKAMNANLKDLHIQIAACNVLNNLIISADPDDALYSKEIIKQVYLAMKTHSAEAALQQVACSLLMAFSSNEQAAEVIGESGGIQEVLAAMRSFPGNATLVATCCNALWSLAVNEKNSKILAEEKGLQDVYNAMVTHADHVDLIEAASAAMLSLSMEDDNLEYLGNLDCVGLLLSAIETHKKEAKVVKNACMALASLVEPDEESAYKVLNNDRDGVNVAGIPIIKEVYTQHRDNAEVVENICTLFMELTEYDDICFEMKDQGVGSVLNEIHNRFSKNEVRRCTMIGHPSVSCDTVAYTGLVRKYVQMTFNLGFSLAEVDPVVSFSSSQ